MCHTGLHTSLTPPSTITSSTITSPCVAHRLQPLRHSHSWATNRASSTQHMRCTTHCTAMPMGLVRGASTQHQRLHSTGNQADTASASLWQAHMRVQQREQHKPPFHVVDVAAPQSRHILFTNPLMLDSLWPGPHIAVHNLPSCEGSNSAGCVPGRSRYMIQGMAAAAAAIQMTQQGNQTPARLTQQSHRSHQHGSNKTGCTAMLTAQPSSTGQPCLCVCLCLCSLQDQSVSLLSHASPHHNRQHNHTRNLYDEYKPVRELVCILAGSLNAGTNE